ncbi:MAG TPA: heme ABC transporter permease [Shinella sp.]|jgi:heme exporter protein C|uniref:heme ABC transporter permease n=1 Tax=Shinella sp. TaxID=1870904 RepID=UPI002E159CD3|nr:heme ABC transporter permease [Shinella sp.]
MSEPSLAIRKFSDLANPTRFLALVAIVWPWLAGLTLCLFAVGLYLAFTTGGDYQQGETVRIMYVHVPAAWLAMMCYTVMALSALGTLVWRHPLADVSAKAAAPIGACFTLVALITGSLWGKPMWGTWWVWDARLTSVFVLFLMYLGLIALNRAMDEPTRAAKVSAVLILVGFVNIPIIKFSVEWWNTLHQPASVIRLDGPTISAEFLRPLLVMAIAFTLLFFTLHILAMRNEILRRRIAVLRRHAARAAGREGDAA